MSFSYWDSTEISLLQANLHLKTVDIYDAYLKVFPNKGRTYDSIQKKVRALRELHKEEEIVTPEGTPEMTGGEEMMSPLIYSIDLKAQLESWLRETSNNFTPQLPSIPSDKPKGSTLVFEVSDIHLGKLNSSYNSAVAIDRILNIGFRIMHKIHKPTDLEKIIFVLLGDEVEGEDIYAHQNSEIEIPVIEQARLFAEAFFQMALDVQNFLGLPIEIYAVPGNHGRMSKTSNPRSNWDNVVYMMLSSLFKQKNKEISFNLNFEEFLTMASNGKKGLLCHQGTKHSGTPAMQVKLLGWAITEDIDFIIHGHWHTWELVGT